MKFNTDQNSFEKVWYKTEASVIRDTGGWKLEDFVEKVRGAVKDAEDRGYRDVRVEFDIEGGEENGVGIVAIVGWKEETDKQWRSRLIWRRDILLRNIEEYEKKDIENSKELVEKINALIK